MIKCIFYFKLFSFNYLHLTLTFVSMFNISLYPQLVIIKYVSHKFTTFTFNVIMMSAHRSVCVDCGHIWHKKQPGELYHDAPLINPLDVRIRTSPDFCVSSPPFSLFALPRCGAGLTIGEFWPASEGWCTAQPQQQPPSLVAQQQCLAWLPQLFTFSLPSR